MLSRFQAGLKTAVLVLVTAALSGCASIVSQSVSDMAKGPGKRLSLEDSGNGYLMLSVPKLDALTKLKLQCPGTLTGISSTLVKHDWFFIVQEYTQEVSAWCQTL